MAALKFRCDYPAEWTSGWKFELYVLFRMFGHPMTMDEIRTHLPKCTGTDMTNVLRYSPDVFYRQQSKYGVFEYGLK